jgi:hypothetical protein
MTTVDREKLVEKEVLAGNVPESMRHFVPVSVTAAGGDTQHTATYYVSPDVLEVGSDGDSFRIPLTPIAAQRIASALDCSLVTRKVSNDIYANAAVKIEPRPFGPPRESVETFYQSDRMIDGQLKQEKGYRPGVLVGGQKKDVVFTPRLKEKPGKVAIYGWHKLDGKAIQPLYLGHADWYVDYSHGIRLMSNHLIVDGKETTDEKVLADPNLAPLLSDEGVIEMPCYPSTAPAVRP